MPKDRGFLCRVSVRRCRPNILWSKYMLLQTDSRGACPYGGGSFAICCIQHWGFLGGCRAEHAGGPDAAQMRLQARRGRPAQRWIQQIAWNLAMPRQAGGQIRGVSCRAGQAACGGCSGRVVHAAGLTGTGKSALLFSVEKTLMAPREQFSAYLD